MTPNSDELCNSDELHDPNEEDLWVYHLVGAGFGCVTVCKGVTEMELSSEASVEVF